jgi:hypothetical protein
MVEPRREGGKVSPDIGPRGDGKGGDGGRGGDGGGGSGKKD